MRVLVVAESFLPQLNGVTNSVLRVLEHLADHGHDAVVVAPGDPPARVSGFPVRGLPSVPMPGYRQFRVGLPTTRGLLQTIREVDPDVIHLASPFVTGVPAVKAARRLGVPTVAVYQTDVAGYAARYSLGQAAEAAWRVVRRIHEQATMTLAPSQVSVEDLRRHGVPRVRLWPRGVDQDRFHPRHRDDLWRRQVGGDVLVGFVGRLAPEKQVEDLAALDGIDGVQLVVVGDGPDGARLRRALPNALFTGQLGGDDLSTALASLDVMVHTGPHETFCQSAQEAMAASVPVVAVGAGAVVELVDPSRTGWLYAPGDLDGLRSAVLDLVGDAGKRQAMGRAARARVAHRTWESIGHQLLGFYHEAVTVSARVGRYGTV